LFEKLKIGHMKSCQQIGAIIIIFIVIISSSCTKEKISSSNFANSAPISIPPPPPVSDDCPNRPVINAYLIPVANLSSARTLLQCASAGNKILFIGGYHDGPNYWNEPVPVDILNLATGTTTVHNLIPDNPQFTHFRFGAGVASLGNKIFIAGGGDGIGDNQTPAIDIYDVFFDTWTKDSLSAGKMGLVAFAAGNKVLFAGGFGYPDGNNWDYFNTVDIYDNNTNSWSTAKLSEARMDISAASLGAKIYFAGGHNTITSKAIDVYDVSTNSWSVSSLQYPRTGMACIADSNELIVVGGRSTLNATNWLRIDNVEQLNLNTGISSLECISPRSNLTAVRKDDNIIFFTGNDGDGKQFEIFNTTSRQWSNARLNQDIRGAGVISVNNTIYVAGGKVNGVTSDQIWKLEF
jgi:N-acetylneuraminic acid mutarotase